MDPSQNLFGFLDMTVVLLYLAGMIAIGLWTARSQKTKRDYFLGGRSLPWWAVGLSIVATETSALTFIGIPAAAIGAVTANRLGGEVEFSMAGGNMYFMMIVVGYITGRLFVMKFIVPKYFTGDVYTTYELIDRAFGRGSRLAVAFVSGIQIIIGAGVRVFVTALPVSILLTAFGIQGGIPLAIFVIMIAAMAYTLFGGIKAVVWTDMAQFIIFIIAGLMTLIYIPTLIDSGMATESGKTGWAAIMEVSTGEGGPFKIWNSGLLTEADRHIVAQEIRLGVSGSMGYFTAQLGKIFSSPYNFIMGLIAAPFGIILAFGFDQMNVQRILACKSKEDGQKALLLSAILIGPQFFLFLMIGTCLFSFYTLNGMDLGGIAPVDPRQLEQLYSGEAIPKVRGDFIYPIFIFTQFPPLMKGFLVAAILAAAMSSVSSALSALGSMALVDFWQPFFGKKDGGDEANELFISRISTVVAGIGLSAMALVCMSFKQNLIDLAFTLSSIPGGPVMGAFLYAMIRKKGSSPWPVIAGLLLGFFGMIFLNFYHHIEAWMYTNLYEVYYEEKDLFKFGRVFYWPWHALIGASLTLFFAFLWEGMIALGKPAKK